MADQAPSGQASLVDLLTRLGEAEDPDRAFIDEILRDAAAKDPELPEILRAGAIPRSLDETIVGVLRGATADGRNRNLLEMISGYGFVMPRPDGAILYHDNTRDALLKDWRSDPDKQERFGAYNEALASFYESRYAESVAWDTRLGEVSSVIAAAAPARLQRLTGFIESRMTETLLEALYHHLLAGPRAGVDFFKASFFELERAGRGAMGRALGSFARDYLRRLPPGESQPELLLWLDYFDTRATQRLEDYNPADAEAALKSLLERPGMPDDLRPWVLDELGFVYEAQLKMKEAVDTRLELTRRLSGIDPYNDPLRHNLLGELYSQLGDFVPALAQFELAIEKGQLPEARDDVAILARLGASDVYRRQGDAEPAFEAAIEALHLARTSFPGDRVSQRLVAAAFGTLLQPFDVRAADCASAEGISLADPRVGQRSSEFLDVVSRLIRTGRIRTARAWLERLQADHEEWEPSPTTVRPFIAYHRAWLLEHEGQDAEACAEYTRLVEDVSAISYGKTLRTNALEHRGRARMRQGDLAGAVEDLTAARDEWSRRGCTIHAANVELLLAEASIKAGDPAEAGARLDAAHAGMPEGPCPYTAETLRVEGDLQAWQGDWPAALQSLDGALEAATRRDEPATQLALLHKLAASAVAQSGWTTATDYAAQLERTADRLAFADAYNPTGRETAAERENAGGMACFCLSEDRRTALERAREQFSDAAASDPENFWPLLNLSFTYAEQQDWLGATKALQDVLRLCPEAMRTRRLYQSLADYVLRFASRRYSTKDGGRAKAADAAAAVEAALGFLSGSVPPDQLARVRTVHFALLALAGEASRAQQAYRTATSVTDHGDVSAGEIAPLIDDVDAYWSVASVLQAMEEDPSSSAALRGAVELTHKGLVPRLDDLMGLTSHGSPENYPMTTPIVVEVGDGIVPMIDPAQDGGRFLNELIPAMKERIAAGTGVTVPGLRFRGSQLPPTAYSVQIDEVPVLAQAMALDVSFDVRPEREDTGPHGELTAIHPLTGEPGLWRITPAIDGENGGPVTPELYLIHHIELLLRSRLIRFLGPQEVQTLLDTGVPEDRRDLVATVVPDSDALLGLTWVLQGLLEDGIPVRDLTTILEVIRDAGGLDTEIGALRRVVRSSLGGPPSTARPSVAIPPQLERSLLADGEGVTAISGVVQARQVFRSWLKQKISEDGPGITLVATSEAAQDVARRLARSEDPLIRTVVADHER